jgi:hypothetical protein
MSSMQESCWIANVKPIGAPTSATICGRRSSLCLSSASFNCCRPALRRARLVDQSVSSNARRAAAIARSMSATEPSATGPITDSVAGLTLSNVLLPSASTSTPSINMRGSKVKSIGQG